MRVPLLNRWIHKTECHPSLHGLHWPHVQAQAQRSHPVVLLFRDMPAKWPCLEVGLGTVATDLFSAQGVMKTEVTKQADGPSWPTYGSHCIRRMTCSWVPRTGVMDVLVVEAVDSDIYKQQPQHQCFGDSCTLPRSHHQPSLMFHHLAAARSKPSNADLSLATPELITAGGYWI